MLQRARLTSSSDHQEYSVFSKEQLSSLQHLKPENGLPLSVYLGAAGAGSRSRFIPSLFKMYQPCIPSGLTAFAGWEEFSNAKKVRFTRIPSHRSKYLQTPDRATRCLSPLQPELWARQCLPSKPLVIRVLMGCIQNCGPTCPEPRPEDHWIRRV